MKEMFSGHFLPFEPGMQNYISLIVTYKFHFAFFNSIYISSIYTIGSVFFCTLCGYGFNKYRFTGKMILFMTVLASMMIPFETTMVPLYQIIKNLGWINKHIGLIVPSMVNAFGVFFIYQYMFGISNEIIESGRIDGAGEFGIFLNIILPVCHPAMTSLAIVFFMNTWNSYLWPLIVLRNIEKLTLAVALNSLQQSPQHTPYNLIMAGAVISVIPLIIFFCIFQKHFISGITSGAVKE
jgi:ABC-type glycerol-3-phosphate transport system permease component